MSKQNYKKTWELYRDQELKKALPIIEELGFVLEDKQVHIAGERFLSSGQKLVLIGRQKKDNKKVVIKISSHRKQINEIKNERKHRKALSKIIFSYHKFYSPKEVFFTRKNNYYISIVEYIEQEKTFLERSQKEQFFLSLKAFETQEGVHATTYQHVSSINKIFDNLTANDYIKKFQDCQKNIISFFPQDKKTKNILQKAETELKNNQNIINLYKNFLTHWDFVPHNIRIKKNNIYLLDHSSIRFGNKHESWARFINFMLLYNRTLEKNLLFYLEKNRCPEESESLRLMRIFRLSELLSFYTNTLKKAEGNLRLLNQKRFQLWLYVLESLLDNKPISQEILDNYKKDRDQLRSSEEKQRQKKLH
jgi:hypothetical protein